MADSADDASGSMDHLVLEDRALSRAERGAKRNHGSRASGSSAKGRDILVSKALSKLLRHRAEDAGITLDKEGYAPLDKVLEWGPIRSLKATVPEIRTIVSSNDKQRFTLKPNPATNPDLDDSLDEPAAWLIRANQGHSLKLDSEALLRPLTPDTVPPVVVHGTYFAFWSAIVESGGLKKMGRNHVHFSTGLPEDPEGVISGMRADAELLVYVDVKASMDEGMNWWISENGVVLTEGDDEGTVPSKYFTEVVGRKRDVGVLWKDGQKIADLPSNIKGRVPPGKGGSARRGGRDSGRGRGRA